MGHLKPIATAPKPKPKPKPRKSAEVTGTVLKSSDDIGNSEKESTSSEVKDVGTDYQVDIPESVTDLRDCFSTVTINREHVPSPPPDYENVADEEDPVIENVACIEEAKGPVQMDSETSDYQSKSRGSMGDDVMHTACSVANGNMALSGETSTSRREV